MILAQAAPPGASTFLEQAIGPGGGLIITLAALVALAYYHKAQAAEWAVEARRLNDERVEAERARSEMARELIDRIETNDKARNEHAERRADKSDGRWSRLGMVLARIEGKVSARAKAQPPPPSSQDAPPDLTDLADNGQSIFGG